MRKIWWGIALALLINNAHAGPIMEWDFTIIASDWFDANDSQGPSGNDELLIGKLRYEAGTRTIKSLSATSIDQDYGFSTYSDDGYELLYDYYAPRNQYAWLLDIPVKDTTGKALTFSFGEIFVWVQEELEHATLDNRMMHYFGWMETTSATDSQMRYVGGEFFLQRTVNEQRASVPEPASIGLMSLAVLGLGAVRRRKQAA